jgi:HEAT repeat protein
MNAILKKLSGGNRTSLGRTNQVVAQILSSPSQFPSLIDGLLSGDAVIRMRAADAIEKITVTRPDVLAPYKAKILKLAARETQIEVRWHFALLLPRFSLSARERALAIDILFDYLGDRSSIVKTHAIEGLARLALKHPKLKSQILPVLAELTEIGTAAMRARGRKLLPLLNRPSPTA